MWIPGVRKTSGWVVKRGRGCQAPGWWIPIVAVQQGAPSATLSLSPPSMGVNRFSGQAGPCKEAALACCSLWRPEPRAERATRIQPPPPPPAMPPLRSWQQQELLAPAPASSLLDLGAEHTLPTQKCRADARGGSGRDSAVLLVAAAQGDMEGPWPLGTVWS